jgi:arylsulfatase A-like enzyme
MPDPKDLAEFENLEFPFPENFFDGYDKRQAAANQDMPNSKTMLMHYDLKIGVDYNKRGMFGRMNEEQKKVYKDYYDRAQQSYEKIKHDSIEVVKWKYQRYLRDYLATARSMDRNIGRILDYLDSTGLASNTIVIYTFDQGFYMGEHGWFDKRFMYGESLRTPFMMKYPGKIQPGSKVDQMIVNIDFAPTLIDYAGVNVPKEMQGKSFKNLVSDLQPVKDWRKSMYYHYYEYPDPHRVAPHIGIRTEQYKLIRFYCPIDRWELFDIKSDPTEMHNIIETASEELITSLKKQLLDLAREYKDEEAVALLMK